MPKRNRWDGYDKFALENQQARFLKYVDKTSSPKECHLWIGSKFGPDGYGQIKITMSDGTIECIAHRIAYIWEYGFIPEGKIVCHKRFCNDKACVNVAHLYAGTYKQNTADVVALLGNSFAYPKIGYYKYRMQNGQSNNNATFSNIQVRIIRMLHRRGYSISKLAIIFDAVYKTVWFIVRRRTWKHVS